MVIKVTDVDKRSMELESEIDLLHGLAYDFIDEWSKVPNSQSSIVLDKLIMLNKYLEGVISELEEDIKWNATKIEIKKGSADGKKED